MKDEVERASLRTDAGGAAGGVAPDGDFIVAVDGSDSSDSTFVRTAANPSDGAVPSRNAPDKKPELILAAEPDFSVDPDFDPYPTPTTLMGKLVYYFFGARGIGMEYYLGPDVPKGTVLPAKSDGMFGRKRPPTGGPLPEPASGFFSRATYTWIHPFVATGKKRTLVESDLFTLHGDLSARTMGDRLESAWVKELERARKEREIEAKGGRKARKAHLWRALWTAFGREICNVAFYRFVSDTASVCSPLVVLALVTYLQNTSVAVRDGTDPPSSDMGYGLAVALFMAQVVAGWYNHKGFEKGMRAGFRVRSALTSSLYLKCLRLSPKGRQQCSQGRIVNTMSTDTGRMDRATAFLNLVWSVPYLIIVAMALLIYNLGVSALAGCFLLIILGPVQVMAMRHLAHVRNRAALVTDKRVKVTQEALIGVRVMKLYAWEDSFLATIADLRKKELVLVRTLLLYRAAISAATTILPAFAAIITFVAFSLTGGVLTTPIVFTSLALFNVLRIPSLLIPIIATDLTDAKVSLDRLNEIMLADELDSPPTQLEPGRPIAVSVKDGDFLWDILPDEIKDDGKRKRSKELKKEKAEDVDLSRASTATGLATLQNINITVPRGALVAVVGPVGSGKSSLLNAMVGEMRRTNGSVEFSGSVGYCPQTAWIQNSTLKDNILFNAPFDAERYAKCIRDCALTRDLTVLPAGDATEIGERGINLSGGQRQRVSLARAVYFDADIILLDDPLSAVDAHVGRYLFENCIMGALSGKTRILVTHQLHFLPHVDYIYMMDKGRIVEQGTYAELLASGHGFAKLIAEFGSVDAEKNEGQEEEDKAEEDALKAVAEAARQRQADEDATHAAKKAEESDGKLMQSEKREAGNVSGKVFLEYMKASGGVLMALATLILLILAQLARIGTDLWLTWWSSNNFHLSTNTYLDVYVIWGFIQVVTAIASGVIFAFACIIASQRLHDRALSHVFKAPMEFFDTTPLGRILNRFSRDVDTLDSQLPETSRLLGYTLSLILGTLALCVVIFPYFLIALAPAGIGYYFAQSWYRATSRELKRLDNVTRSPLFAHFSSGLSGLATIRAYRVEKRFADVNLSLLDWNNRAYFPLIMTQRWLGLRLEAIAAFLIFSCSLFAIAARFSVGAGLAGLAISYSLQVTGLINWCVRVATDTEQNMVSCERMIEFDTLESEAISNRTEPPASWPATGAITLDSLEMRYRDGLPLVLKGVSVDIKPGEKVAVVGRTGAGKSSIIVALLRLVEPTGGRIVIDGVDISSMSVRTLRSRIAVIPQDPVLFSGTLRSNLDPFGERDDAAIWEALERADLKHVVLENPKGLEMLVAEGGENWSTGQRQLICLARAMLRNASIVILDEATASVDLATDDLIQRAIRRDFSGKTVITIAHRLNTVIDYDRVLVLSHGEVAEFDTPEALLNRHDGVFHGMVADTGKESYDLLRSKALRH